MHLCECGRSDVGRPSGTVRTNVWDDLRTQSRSQQVQRVPDQPGAKRVVDGDRLDGELPGSRLGTSPLTVELGDRCSHRFDADRSGRAPFVEDAVDRGRTEPGEGSDVAYPVTRHLSEPV